MKYLISPVEYPLINPRIDGFRKLKEVGARTVEISVFSLETFQYFLSHKELPPEFIGELKAKTEQIIEDTPTHAAVVRRAFVVPGLANPPGPYFLGLTNPETALAAVNSLYQFAISQGYHQLENSQISGFLYPFIDPEKYNKNTPNVAAVPYGGYAIFNSGKIEIYAVFGNNEGVQSLVADRYDVETRGSGRFLIIKKEVPQKNLMLCTTAEAERDQIPVPIELQFEQVLVDNEILEVARVIAGLSEKYGPQRVEFTADRTGLIFNEVADYWEEKKETANVNLNLKGTILTIKSLSDLAKLSKVSKEDLSSGKLIVKVDEGIIANRDYDILGTLAAWRDKFYVLYPGVAATQHAMRVLTDKGHRTFLVGNQKFDEGDETQIVVAGGKVRVTNLNHAQNQKTASLWDASLLGIELCGGKADRLSKLKIAGYQVPHGIVLTTKFCEGIGQNKVGELIPDYVNSDKLFAVRSSATIEDDSHDSMAGLFETFLNVPGKELGRKATAVTQSTFSPRIRKYLEDNPAKTSILKMAVIVQEMVDARCAGVIFGAKAQTRNLDIVEIETKRGLGEGIVSGETKEIEQIKFSRAGRHVIERRGPKILSPSEAQALFLLSERLRSEFGDVPQDVEWAIDKNGQIWVLQSRDLYLGL